MCNKYKLFVRICRNAIPYLSILTLCLCLQVYAQFPPRAGEPGTTAIHKDSAIWKAGAIQATVQRGYIDITTPSDGWVSAGSPEAALGFPGENGVLSLGDGGSVILEFEYPIWDGPGFDFAVFENGFLDKDSLDFLELAFVEVSSDGIHYFRFPSVSLTHTQFQADPFEGLDARKIHNLAGKYVAGYGTPFDLSEIPDTFLLDKNNIRFIRIEDVVGIIDPEHARYDALGNIINDPWPTPYPTGGFDLDAVGVIHQNSTRTNNIFPEINPVIFPNPIQAGSLLYGLNAGVYLLKDIQGNILLKGNTDMHEPVLIPSIISPGNYFLIQENILPVKILIN